MKILTKTVFLSLAMVLTIFSASAQQTKMSVAETAKTETDGIVAALGLDETKATALYAVNLKFVEQVATHRKELQMKKKAGNEVAKEDRQAANKVINDARFAAQKEVLGRENMKAFQVYRKQLRSKKMAKVSKH